MLTAGFLWAILKRQKSPLPMNETNRGDANRSACFQKQKPYELIIFELTYWPNGTCMN
jgi:hypothetical protein